jgi:uncharacterized protein (TIGR02300 family)
VARRAGPARRAAGTLLTAALPAAKGSTTFSDPPERSKDFRPVAKPELGTKRLCGSCGAKFYDLNKDPILCPKCGTEFQVVVPVATRGRPDAAAAAAAASAAAAARAPAAKAVETDAPENADVELVSLEDADAEAQGKKADGEGVDVDDDLDIEETEEAPFIEETEEGDDDVTDIIGEAPENEDET